MVPQQVKWGPLRFTENVAQRVPYPPRDDEAFIAEQLPYLAALCKVAREGGCEFYTTFELKMEEFRQRGPDEGYLGINLIRGVPMKETRSPIPRSIAGGAGGNIGLTENEQMDFFRSIQHPRFLQIRKAVGEAHIDDAFHLWSAEEESLDVFLTLDGRFKRVVFTQTKHINSSVAVLHPMELCEEMGLAPLDIDQLAAGINPFR
ncbi:MAG TPA: hypothetical protein VGL53_24255 [Bryobacteraceae bacterium]|jgi:hypothetical protein